MIAMTSLYDIILVHGCILVMCYNSLPNTFDYRSQHESMGNISIKTLISKLHFNYPEKPNDASKTFYIDELESCYKFTYPKARTESRYQHRRIHD